MNINDLREHVRGIISERIYSNGGLTPDYEAIYNDFMQSVEKQGGIKSDNGSPLTELEGTAFVFGTSYEYEFEYEVYNRQYVKAHHGDNYNEPEYEELGGDFDFAITNAKVMDKEGDFVCDFDEIAERIDGGYDTVKEWFVFNESNMIEDDLLNEAKQSENANTSNGSHSVISHKRYIRESEQKYPVLNSPRSMGQAFKSNMLGEMKRIPETVFFTTLTEGVDWDIPAELRGGIITFATSVNSIDLDSRGIINAIKKKAESIKNALTVNRKVNRVAKRNNVVGLTLGHFLTGKYLDRKKVKDEKTGEEKEVVKVFDDRSLSLED